MNNSHIPSHDDLPSASQLVKSTVIAILAAGVILVTTVLPAEYGIDPTGFGEMIGLVKMGEIKSSLAEEAETEAASEASHDAEPEATTSQPEAAAVEEAEEAKEAAPTIRSDEMTLTLAPNQGKEIKLTMPKGEQVNFEWWTSGGKANFDTHADSKALKIKYHNYEKGKLERSEGTLTAEFDGNHGWFWRNRTDKDMTVTLKVSGAYTEVLRF